MQSHSTKKREKRLVAIHVRIEPETLEKIQLILPLLKCKEDETLTVADIYRQGIDEVAERLYRVYGDKMDTPPEGVIKSQISSL